MISMLAKKAMFYVFILTLVWLMSGCGNTAKGFGDLVKGIGTDISTAAENQMQ